MYCKYYSTILFYTEAVHSKTCTNFRKVLNIIVVKYNLKVIYSYFSTVFTKSNFYRYV